MCSVDIRVKEVDVVPVDIWFTKGTVRYNLHGTQTDKHSLS